MFRLGHFEAAAEQYRKAIRVDLKHAGAWNDLASLMLSQKKYDQAKEEMAQAEAKGVVIQSKLKTAVMNSLGPNLTAGE